MPDQGLAGLEEPLLQARQGPSLDGDGQNQPTQQIAEVVSDHSEGGLGRLWVTFGKSEAHYQRRLSILSGPPALRHPQIFYR